VVLGYLDANEPLAGGVLLDAAGAQRAVAGLAVQLGMTPEQCASGIRRVACAEMAGALRVLTVERGIDPRGYALLAFGGAGPLHATDVADELGVERILVPRNSGVLAALGLVVAGQRRDVQRSVFLTGEQLTAERLREEVADLAGRARRALGQRDRGDRVELTVIHDLRYAGQSFELPIAAAPEATPAQLRELFESEHERRYGYRDAEQALELVTIRVSASLPAATIELRGDGDRDRDDDDGDLAGGITGPAIVRLPESTLLVTAGWKGRADETGTIHLERAR
jgi:N-methylhydantoinase A/oxoprolinase/acetone carboxylase beta subunit